MPKLKASLYGDSFWWMREGEGAIVCTIGHDQDGFHANNYIVKAPF